MLNGPYERTVESRGIASGITTNGGKSLQQPLPRGSLAYSPIPVSGKPRLTSLNTAPASLYQLSERWLGERDTSSGWGLVRALRSEDPGIRTIAAELLAKTEHIRLPVAAIRRIGRPAKITCQAGRENARVRATRSRDRSEVAEYCRDCRSRKDHWFCGMSQEGLRILEATRHPSTYPSDAVLFAEGQSARGAFVLCSGQVKLFTTSREGKIFIIRIATAGEVLGLSAAVTGQNHALTAETSGPCHVNFLAREALVSAMETNTEFSMRACLTLSREFQDAYRDIHDLVLAPSSSVKLARLLLSWTSKLEKSLDGPEVRIPSSLTHEEMAQMIGASRETVTRLLGDLKKRDFIRLEGSTLVIRDRTALEALTV